MKTPEIKDEILIKIQAILAEENLEHLLDQLIKNFEEHGVTDSILGDLSEPDFLEMGITKIGERKRLRAAFSQSCSKATAPLVTPQSDFTYEAQSGEVSITGFTGQGHVVIPEEFDGLPLPVRRINKRVFANKGGIVSISLPKTLNELGEKAFANCSSLKRIKIPEGVHLIGEQAFSECIGLEEVELPESLRQIGPEAFKNCSSLIHITIPKTVKRIGTAAFNGCTKITNINIQDSDNWDSFDFKGWINLKSIVIPDGVKTINKEMFEGCTNLRRVRIPQSVTKIGDAAFRDCGKLKSVQLPEGLTKIDWRVFYGCKGLKAIQLPRNIKAIGWYSFKGCSNLESIELPEGVTEIGSGAFEGCKKLVKFNIPSSVTRIGQVGLLDEEDPFSEFAVGKQALEDWKLRNEKNLTIVKVDDGFLGTWFYEIQNEP